MPTPFISDGSQVGQKVLGQQHVAYIVGDVTAEGEFMQHGNVNTGSVAASSQAATTVTLTKAYANTSYDVYACIRTMGGTIITPGVRAAVATAATFTITVYNFDPANTATGVFVTWWTVGQ